MLDARFILVFLCTILSLASSSTIAWAQARRPAPAAPKPATKVSEAGLRELAKRKFLAVDPASGSIDTIAPKRGEFNDQNLKDLVPFQDLKYLNLVRTQATGSGLKDLAALPIEELNLEGSPISDEGMAAIARLPRLKTLRLDGDVSDLGMQEFRKLKQLQHLTLYGLKISDAGLAELKHVDELTTLRLFNVTRLNSTGLGELRNLKRLQSLTFEYDTFDDSIFPELAKFQALSQLYFYGPNVTGVGAQHLKTLKPLSSLNLAPTNAGLKDIAELDQLKSLTLRGGSYTDEGLLELARLKNLRFLSIWTKQHKMSLEQQTINSELFVLTAVCIRMAVDIGRWSLGLGDQQETTNSLRVHFELAVQLGHKLSRYPSLAPDLTRPGISGPVLKQLGEALPGCKVQVHRY